MQAYTYTHSLGHSAQEGSLVAGWLTELKICRRGASHQGKFCAHVLQPHNLLRRDRAQCLTKPMRKCQTRLCSSLNRTYSMPSSRKVRVAHHAFWGHPTRAYSSKHSFRPSRNDQQSAASNSGSATFRDMARIRVDNSRLCHGLAPHGSRASHMAGYRKEN